MQRLAVYLVLVLVVLAVGLLADRFATQGGRGEFVVATPGAPALEAS
ncbi:hypothetical protein [Phenylobacterium sp.]